MKPSAHRLCVQHSAAPVFGSADYYPHGPATSLTFCCGSQARLGQSSFSCVGLLVTAALCISISGVPRLMPRASYEVAHSFLTVSV